jgi:hypothetical protein
MLHVPVQGMGTVNEHFAFIYFRADWGDLVRGHETDAFLIEEPDARGYSLIAEKNLGMFVPQPQDAPTLSKQASMDLLKRAIGRADVAIEIIEVAPWQPEQRIAERFREGSAYLVGERRSYDAPEGRPRCQHSRSKRAKPGLEAGCGAARQRRLKPAVDLSSGAVSGSLVRGGPDGFVAWREGHLSMRPESLVEKVLDRVLCRGHG